MLLSVLSTGRNTLNKIIAPFALVSVLATAGCGGGSTIATDSTMSEGELAAIETDTTISTTEPTESIQSGESAE